MAECIIIVPCYNEADRLDLDAFHSFAAQRPEVSFLFVNDGSGDDTSSVLACLCESNPEQFQSLDVPQHNDHSAAFYANGDWASCHAPLNYFPKPPTPKDWPNVISFRSRHPGGANFALADGSVRFVAETIEHGLYRSLSTKSGGEVGSVP